MTSPLLDHSSRPSRRVRPVPVLPPIVDDVTRRQFVAMLGAAGLLAACGDDSDGEREAATGPAVRTVTADDGPIEVPTDPRRVVAAIGSFETDIVAVGIMPVLTTTFAGPWVELDPSVTITENIPPTPEELLRADPDLIIGWNWVTQEPTFDEIAKIAPYIGLGESAATAGPGFDRSEPFRSWDTLFLSVCDAVGRRSRGEELVADFETRLDELAERTPTQPDRTIAFVEFYQQGSFSRRGQNEDVAELMRRVGLQVDGPDATDNEASLETLPDIGAGQLVVAVGGGMDPALYDQVKATPLYQAIPAVQADRVRVVDGTLWSGFGHLWARSLVDDLERLFF